MNSDESNHLQSTARIGYWSSFLLVVFLIVHSITYYPVIKSGLMPAEHFDIEAWMAFVNKAGILTNGFLPQASALMIGIFWLILTACIYSYAPSNKKIFALIGLCFSIMSCTLLSMSEFAQWVSLRRSAFAGDFSGLAQFTQSNMNSFVFAMIVLSVHILLSISFLFLAPIFNSNKFEKNIAGLLIVMGAVGGTSIIGIVTGILPFLFIHDSVGSIAMLAALILLMIFWKRIEKPIKIK